MSNQQYAKFLEAHISFDDMIIFVCEDKEDQENFLHQLKDLQRLRIHSALMPRESVDSFQPRRPIKDLQ